jgi:hypothetical protein
MGMLAASARHLDLNIPQMREVKRQEMTGFR